MSSEPSLEAQVEALERENARLEQRLLDRGWLEDVLDATNNTVVVTDPHAPDNPIIYANRGFERLTGYTLPETLGRNCRFLQGDDTGQPEVARLREAVREGKNVRVVLRNYRKDGSPFWNELYLTAVYRGGALSHFVGVQNDVTRSVEAEEERFLLAAAVEQADESILITDADLGRPGPRITYVNAAFERLTGHRRDEVVGRSPRLLQGPKTDPQVLARLRRTLAAGETWRGESTNYRKDGTPFANEWHIAPIERGGKTTHWVATQRDVTERRELERLVLEASALEQQRVARDLHDTLGQQLTGTAFVGAALVRELEDAAAAGRSVTPKHAAEAQQLVALVNEANAQTRALARGLYPVDLARGGFAGALGALCERFKTVYGVPCTFTTGSSGDPEASQEEALHLYHIAQEALNNASKHARAERFAVRWVQAGAARTLSVQDDGVGLGDEATRAPGLGLRIMRYRAGLVGGTLTVVGAEGGGTVVSCTLLTNPPGPT